MSSDSTKCQKDDCPNPPFADTCLCVMHIDERFEYAKPDTVEYTADLIDR